VLKKCLLRFGIEFRGEKAEKESFVKAETQIVCHIFNCITVDVVEALTKYDVTVVAPCGQSEQKEKGLRMPNECRRGHRR
jgi:hypothetical protein